jgi:5'-nucleotidase
MKISNLVNHALRVALMGAGLVLFACTTQTVGGETTPLNILLTNDDGYDTPGIKAVRSALLEAGHDVTLVAPLKNQSSSGARVTSSGTLDYMEHSKGVWSVDGSPADSVLVGLLHIMKEDTPALVVSGANFGQNPGYAINSGTVGAATVAMYAGFPAIAVSVAVDFSEVAAEPYPFPSTLRAFPGAAAMIVGLIEDLQETRADNGDLLPPHMILNVNYPALSTEEIKGIKVVPAARTSGVLFDYEETGETGQLKVRVQPIAPQEAGSTDADWQMLGAGFVTISVLDGDWDAGQSLRESISARLSASGQ